MYRFYVLGVAVAVVILVGSSYAGYSGVEVYPTADACFLAGGDLGSRRMKIDLWATPGSEVAVTLGPKIGPVAIGLGASMGPVEGKLGVSYINTDLGMGFDVGPLQWQSYNLYQAGQQGVEDFAMSRNWLAVRGWPVGIVGHNKKVGDRRWQLFWGPYLQLGKRGIFGENRFAVAVDLKDNGSLWGVWKIGF